MNVWGFFLLFFFTKSGSREENFRFQPNGSITAKNSSSCCVGQRHQILAQVFLTIHTKPCKSRQELTAPSSVLAVQKSRNEEDSTSCDFIVIAETEWRYCDWYEFAKAG